MNFKKIRLILITTLFISILFSCMGLAEEELVDPNIPESWYEEPQTASEIGIKEFNQSPILEERVTQGKLASVKERLPEDPPVIEPLSSVGNYSDEITIWSKADFRGNTMYFKWPEHNGGAGRPTPDGQKIVPNLVKRWEFTDDYKGFTIYLREGLRWSDGEPVTAEDYLYWWEYEANNEDITLTPPEEWNPALLDVVKEGKYAVTFKFDEEVPRYPQFNFQYGMGPGISPAHYMKQFHPDFVEKSKLEDMADDVGLENWYDYYGRLKDDSPDHPEYEHQRPVLRQYIVKERTETYMVWERNPYWPFVDTAGNQLPYIDTIRVNRANTPEMAASKAVTGEATLAGRFTKSEEIPMYKKYEKNENYKALIYYRAYGAEISVMPNLTHEDPKLRAIFQNDKFRKALSLAIDRDTINEKIYYGHAISMQATLPPVSKYYKKEYAEAYADFDPERAKEFLDDMGMVDRDGDGYREMPERTLETMSGDEVKFEGEKFNPTFIYCRMMQVEPTRALELMTTDWDEIGLNIDMKKISRELRDTRWESGKGDISSWAVDVVTDITFGDPSHISKCFAPGIVATYSPWPSWVNWRSTNGEEGDEPPAEIKELIKWAKILANTTDEEERTKAADNLLKAQAENLWTIGTVGMGPQPIIINDNLKNVPEKGIWDWGLGYMYSYYPSQFYLEE